MTQASIQPSRRVDDVSEYYFSRKLREVAEMNRNGAGIISLGIGGPDRPPHSLVVETLCEEAYKDDVHGYQPDTGLPELRKAYASWYKNQYSVTLDPEREVLPLLGSKEGVLHISLAFLNHGDRVLVPNPGHPAYATVSRIVGAETVDYELLPENGYMPDFDALERMDLSGVKLMWANYTHMPTGTTANPELFEKLINFGLRHGIVIAHHNPYSFTLNDSPMSILQTPGAREIAVELNSLSKSHNMAGWRMGVVASNPKFTEWILRVKSNIDSGQFRPMMKAAACAVQLHNKWYKTLNDSYKRRRVIAEKILTTLGCTFSENQTGLFLWARIPETEISDESFCDRVLDTAKVFLTPGSVFGSNGRRYVRVSLCVPSPRLRVALERIERSLEAPVTPRPAKTAKPKRRKKKRRYHRK